MFTLEHLSTVHCHGYRWLIFTEALHNHRHVNTQSILILDSVHCFAAYLQKLSM
jgi:hypothetical protein